MNTKTNLMLGGGILLLLIGASVATYFVLLDDDENGEDIDQTVVLTINSGSQTKTLTLHDITHMTGAITAKGGYKKTTGTIVGPYEYTGIPVVALLAEMGGVLASQELIVRATDEFFVTYSQAMVHGQVAAFDTQGNDIGQQDLQMVLIYEETGEAELSGGPLRIAYLGEDGYLTDGHLWTKYVCEMEIVAAAANWEIMLYGLRNHTLTRDAFESAMYCGSSPHRATYEIEDDGRTHVYEGIALWVIVSMIDGGEPGDDSHYIFNRNLIGLGYMLSLNTSTGINTTVSFDDMAEDENYILAAKIDSLFLEADEGPLKIVGAALTAEEMVNCIVEIYLYQLD